MGLGLLRFGALAVLGFEIEFLIIQGVQEGYVDHAMPPPPPHLRTSSKNHVLVGFMSRIEQLKFRS